MDQPPLVSERPPTPLEIQTESLGPPPRPIKNGAKPLWAILIGCIVLGVLSTVTVLVFVRGKSTTKNGSVQVEILTKQQAIDAVKRQYPEVRSIDETPEQTIGKSMDIRVTQRSDGWRLLFWQGSGDCPAGCLNDHEWYFVVHGDGTLEKKGEYERIYNSKQNGYDEKGARIEGFLDEQK